MALIKKKHEELPSDAIILNEDEAFIYHWKIIEGWNKKSEVWALQYAPGIFGALSAGCGVFVNSYYRRKLKLGRYGQLSSYLPIVVLPAIMSVVHHKGYIQKAIVLRTDECPVCTQIRSASFQSFFSTVYPTLLSPLASFMFATRHYTFRLPSITSQPKEVFILWRKITKSLVPFLTGSILANALIAMFLTYKEIEQSYNIQTKLLKLEEKLDQKENQFNYTG